MECLQLILLGKHLSIMLLPLWTKLFIYIQLTSRYCLMVSAEVGIGEVGFHPHILPDKRHRATAFALSLALK